MCSQMYLFIYKSYENALLISGLDTLEHRRIYLCLQFAKKAAKHPKHQHSFQEQECKYQTLEVRKLNSKIYFVDSGIVPYHT